MDAPLDAYVFAATATQSAVDDALDLVTAGTARAALPVGSERELYVAVDDTSAAGLLTKLAAVLTINGLTGVEVHLGIGSPPPSMPFPTQGSVDDYVGFALLTTAPSDTVSVYDDAIAVTGVVGAAMVGTGTVSVLVEATSDSTTTLTTMLGNLTTLTGVTDSVTVTGAVANGAGFTTS